MTPTHTLRRISVTLLLLVAFLFQGTWALAGTTGSISGTLLNTTNGQGVADANVSVVSASGSATTTTDAGGRFRFLTLAPDTYTVSANKKGFSAVSASGITVFADQTQTVSLATHPELATIANVTSRAAGNLVKPGTTSDVYSVNAATQAVVSGSGGGFNLNSAYSGIYSQPGVTSYIGSYGWGQAFYIRGGAYSQVGYEFDGVPVNRAFDNYQANSLSSLGQQELQVYTGGSPAGASSATLGGFINQVIKTGTYPGSGTLKAGLGAPGFYHALSAEVGGANPDRTFSYFVGLNGYNQSYPYGNWNRLSNISPDGLSSYGLIAPSEVATLYGGLAGFYGAPPDGGAYAFQYGNGPFPRCQNGGVDGGIAVGYTAANPGPFNGACLGYGPYGNGYSSEQFERNTVLNFHFAIPHKHDGGRDDIQLLYDNSMQYLLQSSDINDQGGLPYIDGFLTPYNIYSNPGSAYPGLCGYVNALSAGGCATSNSPLPYVDSKIFAPGTSFGQTASTATINPYYFPNSPTNREINNPFTGSFPSGLPVTNRDGNFNDVGIVKGQYTKNIGSRAYARLFGYTFYSDWLISGPDCAADGYIGGFLEGGLCGNTGDYELTTHTRGAELQFADQINSQNLLQLTGNYTTAGVTRFNNSSWLAGYYGSRTGVTSLTTGDPNTATCYSYKKFKANGVTYPAGSPVSCFYSAGYGTFGSPTRGMSGDPCAAGQLPAGSPACLAGAKWLVTTPGGQGTFNTVKPAFSSISLTDEFKPNDKLDINAGVRMETYTYNLNNSNTPEFNFWFNAASQVDCYDPATGLPQLSPLVPGQPVPPNVVNTRVPNSPCGIAPSGQQGLHPNGGGPNGGPIRYTAQGAASFTHTLYSPRLGFTYTLNPDTVIRGTVGKYTQPTETAFEQYLDQSGKRAADFDFSRFFGLGFNTPAHDNPVQYSVNYDFSLEHHFRGTDMSLKVSPFYRDTHNEIATLVLGPGFVSGVNVGHKHSSGVEVQISKGDPARDGWAGQLSYTYTKALVQYGNLPNGTNTIDYLNNYVKAFNALTQAGGGSPCYDPTTPTASGSNSPTACGAPTAITNPYYNSALQPLLARDAYYQSYPNESPNDPTDQGGSSAISPHFFSGFLQYKRGRLAIAPNFQLAAGTYYGSPTDTYGVDPRWCANNQANATDPAGNPVPVTGAAAGNPDFLSCGPTGNTASGYLAIPNPFTGSMDSVGKYQQPWQFNMGALIRYELSPKVSANLSLTNIVNTCFGGSTSPWSTRFKPSTYVCGYGQGNGSYIGPTSGQPGYGGGFFYGSAPTDAANGGQPYAPAYNYPFAPYTGAIPFQAYFELQIKM